MSQDPTEGNTAEITAEGPAGIFNAVPAGLHPALAASKSPRRRRPEFHVGNKHYNMLSARREMSMHLAERSSRPLGLQKCSVIVSAP